MTILAEIFRREELQSDPPVLVDIGASGTLHRRWRAVAPYSVCLAFEPDSRRFGLAERQSTTFKKLLIYHAVAGYRKRKHERFFLTSSPYCSSLLSPNEQSLRRWAFADKFRVEHTSEVNAVFLPDALKEAGIHHVDWFKSDSQGLDLTLFQSLPAHVRKRVLAAEFEPGIIDAYHGEKKAPDVLSVMDRSGFWLADAIVKGSQRISPENLSAMARHGFRRKLLAHSHKGSPGWMELLYLNAMTGRHSLREYLLSWVFATIVDQHGFALEIAQSAEERFHDPLLVRMALSSRRSIMRTVFSGRLVLTAKEKLLKWLGLAE